MSASANDQHQEYVVAATCSSTAPQGHACLHSAGHDGPHEARVIVVRWTDPTEEPTSD